MNLTFKNLNPNQKINFKVLLKQIGFKNLSKDCHSNHLTIKPNNPIFDNKSII